MPCRTQWKMQSGNPYICGNCDRHFLVYQTLNQHQRICKTGNNTPSDSKDAEVAL